MANSPKDERVTMIVCGVGQCKCQCHDGPCEHKFDGPIIEFDGDSSTTCSGCGMMAMSHDMRCF